MSYTITQESFDSLASCWGDPSHPLKWNCIFVLPVWLKVWWQDLGAKAELYLGTVRQGEKIIGVAPLVVRDRTASLLGSVDVCDYLDFVVAPGLEMDFFSVLLDDLGEKGINHLALESLRPDSTVLTDLIAIARDRGYGVLCQPEDVSVELDLPSTWEEYLATLAAKQRHEVRRKLRRLAEAGNLEHRCIEVGQEVEGYIEVFLKLLRFVD